MSNWASSYLELTVIEDVDPDEHNWLARQADIATWVDHFAHNAPFEWQYWPQTINICIGSREQSRQLNSHYRGQDKPTNVLSFPFPNHQAILGDILLCADVINHQAQQQHKIYQAHWAHMVIHGLLHLCGYDHQDDEEALHMEGLEIKLLNQLGYDNPYNDE